VAGKRTVAVAMSGGVDSSVAAALLVSRGHTVLGITLKLFCDEKAGERACCSAAAVETARSVAETLGIPHRLVGAEDLFRERVIEPFAAAYAGGRTPNPCVACNTHVKVGGLAARIGAFGADTLATGHYARLEQTAEGPILRRAMDRSKDQSYVLWGVPREDLSRTMFPLGDLTKEETRAVARDLGLASAGSPESQDICFVGGGKYVEFLEGRDGEAALPRPGPILDGEGNRLGTHGGLHGYTVGQRRGLGIAAKRPLYVKRIDPARNAVIVADEEDLLADRFLAETLNFVSIDPPAGPVAVSARIRYRSEPVPATLVPLGGGRAEVRLERPARAVTPGQSVVFYSGDVVLGGGIIAM
jgi:tRNA-specific 2-thiouridylase